MGRVYVLPMPAQIYVSAQDAWEVSVGSTVAVLVRRLIVEQSTDTDSEQRRLQVMRGIGSTVGSAGTTGTLIPKVTGLPAATSTVKLNNTGLAVAGGGSLTTITERGWNVLNGVEIVFDPPLEFPPSSKIVVRLPDVPADTMNLQGEMEIEEIG